MIYLALEDAKGDGAVNLIAKQQNKWLQCYAPVGIALRFPERSRESATMLCTPLPHFRSHEPHSNNTSALLNHIINIKLLLRLNHLQLAASSAMSSDKSYQRLISI